MEDSLLTVFIVTALLLFAIVTICLIIWAEKTKSLFVRLAILLPFCALIVFNLVLKIMEHFETGRSFLVILDIFFVLILLISLVVGITFDHKKWSSKLIKKIAKKDDSPRKKDN